METLKECIKHLSINLKHYSSLYDQHSLDRATSTLSYLRELQSLKEGEK